MEFSIIIQNSLLSCCGPTALAGSAVLHEVTFISCWCQKWVVMCTPCPSTVSCLGKEGICCFSADYDALRMPSVLIWYISSLQVCWCTNKPRSHPRRKLHCRTVEGMVVIIPLQREGCLDIGIVAHVLEWPCKAWLFTGGSIPNNNASAQLWIPWVYLGGIIHLFPTASMWSAEAKTRLLLAGIPVSC